MKRAQYFHLYTACIILVMLHSMWAWFLWNIDIALLEGPAILFGLMHISSTNYYGRTSVKKLLLFAFVLVVATLYKNEFGMHLPFELKISLILLLLLSNDERLFILNTWTRFYAVLLAVSLVAWVVSLIGLLPSFGIITPPLDNDTYTYINYGLCLQNISGMDNASRFTSIFLEPGHTATVAVFTIVANRFDFHNKYVKLITLCTLFTLSLAGYVLLGVGYVLYLLSKTQKIEVFKKVFAFSLILLGVFIFAKNYKGGDNAINTMIIERLEYDSEKGISGNNRTTDYVDQQYEYFLKSPDLLYGLSASDYRYLTENSFWQGAGYKIYIMQKGILGTMLILLLYLSVFRFANDKRFALCALVVFVLAFIQRAYPMWNAWLYTYVLAVSCNFNLTNELNEYIEL